MTKNDPAQQEYEILWVRHGESQGNVDPQAYANDGDPQVELTEEGWKQAVRAGRFLGAYLQDQGIKEWPHIFLGEFIRHQQTLSGLIQGMKDAGFEGEPEIYPDSRLNEQSFGVLPYMQGKEGDFEQLSKTYSKTVRDDAPYSARPLHGESRRDTEAFVKQFIDGTLKRDMEEGKNPVLIVTSGAVINAAVKSWFHLPMKAWDEASLQNPGNCDIRRISGTPKDWSVTKIYDGVSGAPCHENVIEGIERLTAATLPPVPGKILSELRNEDPQSQGPEDFLKP